MPLGLGGTLTESELQDLVEPIHFWAPEDKEIRQKIHQQLHLCFEKWKRAQVDSEGNVEAFRPLSLDMLSMLPQGKKMPATEVMPWDCAGPFVFNEIDLAFKLWLESYAPMETLIGRYGPCGVFAVCGAHASQRPTVNAGSMIRLNGFLTRQLAKFARHTGKLAGDRGERVNRQDAGLVKARLTSAQQRREKASLRNEQIFRMAVEYFRKVPAKEVEDAVSYLEKYAADLSHASIRAKIKGAKTEALQSLNTEQPK